MLVLAAPELCCSDTDESDVPSPPSPRKAGSSGTKSSSVGLRKRPDASLSPQSGRHGSAKKGERWRAADNGDGGESSVGSDDSEYKSAKARAAVAQEDRLAAEEEALREAKERSDDIRLRKEAAEKEKQQRERERDLARKFTTETEVVSM